MLSNMYFHVLQVTNSMEGVVKSMDSALKSMNLEKVMVYTYILVWCACVCACVRACVCV